MGRYWCFLQRSPGEQWETDRGLEEKTSLLPSPHTRSPVRWRRVRDWDWLRLSVHGTAWPDPFAMLHKTLLKARDEPDPGMTLIPCRD